MRVNRKFTYPISSIFLDPNEKSELYYNLIKSAKRELGIDDSENLTNYRIYEDRDNREIYLHFKGYLIRDYVFDEIKQIIKSFSILQNDKLDDRMNEILKLIEK